MTKGSKTSYDIIIVGAGPAGLSFARLLADTGLEIAVVEKLPLNVLADPPVDGRDIALTHFSAGLLKEIDVWQRFPDDSVSYMKEARVTNGRSPYFLNFDHRDTGEAALGFLVSNHLIRKAVYEAVGDFSNVHVITDCEVVSLDTNSSGASVSLADGRQLEGRLVIAADSRFSKTRQRMGISTEMRDFARVVIVCQMEHELSHGDIAYECFHYDQTLAVLPLVGDKSSIVITLHNGQSDAVMNMDEGAFNADIQARFDDRLGWMKLAGERFAYPLVATYANRFVATRFALMGDAAVGMHPVTAHGYNLGLRGADTLAKAVRSAIARGADIGSDRVLARYEFKHRRSTRPMYLGTNALVRLYTSDDLPARVARDSMLRIGNTLRPVKRLMLRHLTEIGGASSLAR